MMGIRRVVTDNDENGKSFVKWDMEVETVPGRPGFAYFPLWATRKLPAEFTEEDPNTWDIPTNIGGGSVFRICRWEPGGVQRWHRTDSIDYAVVLSGEMHMQLDKQEVKLKPGDVIVQRQTNHNWVNRGPEPCLILFVLVSTEGGKSLGWQASTK